MKLPSATTNRPPGAAAASTQPVGRRLRKAAGSRDPAILPTFLNDHPSITLSDLNDTTIDGRSALHMACWFGATSNVSLLLDLGCNIDTISTRIHNYGNSPIFLAATRSREDVMNLLLDRGANVLIVNNKGQSVYSIACSHFESELIQRIKQIEIEQEDESKEWKGWVDYKQSHPDISDSKAYGDLDFRFLGRPLTDADVIKDGVVNPTTAESRKDNFARRKSIYAQNNQHNPNQPRKKEKQKAKAAKKKEPTTMAVDEQEQLDTIWDQVQSSVASGDSWGVFSSLLSIVQFMEGKKFQYRWVEECASRLDYVIRFGNATLGELALDSMDVEPSDEVSSNDMNVLLSQAILCCESEDRHTTLTKRILMNAVDGPNHNKSPTYQEKKLIDSCWNDTGLAFKRDCPKDAFVSLLKVVIFWDAKNVILLNDCTQKLHSLVEANSVLESSTGKEILEYCNKRNNTRYTSLLKMMLTQSIQNSPEKKVTPTKQSPNSGNGKTKKIQSKEFALPEHYHPIISSFVAASANGENAFPSWEVLMNTHSRANGDTRYLSLPCPPTWVDTTDDLQLLQATLNNTANSSNNALQEKIRLDDFIAFDSEFRSDQGKTELATIQLSILEEGIPLAWVVDLYPDPTDEAYSTATRDMLRWLFVESDAKILGFAHRRDLHMISSYIGEDITVTSNFLDAQLLAFHSMTTDCVSKRDLPGLKSSCAYLLGKNGSSNKQDGGTARTETWQLSKHEQCSNWAQRPLTTSQLEYAGLDAAVLLVLLAEIVRKTPAV